MVIPVYEMQNPSSFDLIADSNPSFRVDEATLVRIVQEKNLQILQSHDGVRLLCSHLETNVESGIPGDEMDITRRRHAFGSNTYSKPPSKAFLRMLAESFQDSTILVLLTCAALSLCFGIKQQGLKQGCYDGASILVVASLVIVMSSMSNFMTRRHDDKDLDEFSRASSSLQIHVVRNRRRQQITIPEVVVGDVVCLEIGDHVPADGLFLYGRSLQVDRSSIDEHRPFLFSGGKVVGGEAKMLVIAVGMNTTRGQMMSSTSQKAHDINNEQMPLQGHLHEITSFLGKVGLAVAFSVVVVLLARFPAGNTKDKDGSREFNGSRTKMDDIVNAIVRTLAHAVTIVVVAIPVGLPLAVTLTRAHLLKKMMADHLARVRKLSSCETMGSTTVICTDKTGILTVNQMKVTKFYVGLVECPHSLSLLAPCIVGLIREGVPLNATDSALHVLNPNSEFEISGSPTPTEKAILSWAVGDLNMAMKLITQNCSILHVDAFNSSKKRSGVMVRRTADGTIHVHWKGAAELILKSCSSYFDASGIVKNLDDDDANSKFEHIIEEMATSGLQCIAFATKQVTEEDQLIGDEEGSKSKREDGLTLIAIVGIKNPCREGVKAVVEACKNADVSVKMITGDNVFTAINIASECGILGPDDQDTCKGVVVEADEFRNYTEEERSEKIDKIRVIGRSSPADKLLVIRCLKQLNHSVIFASKDVQALTEADIGISMGKNAAKEVRESSDIFIGTDNGFAVLVTVLMLARLVEANIQKLISVQLTANVVALVLNSMIMAVPTSEVPITAIDYFGACLIIYIAYCLSLAVNVAGKPVEELIDNRPAERINHKVIWMKVLTRAFYPIAALFILHHCFGKSILFSADSKDNTLTLIFHTFVLHQVYNEFHSEQKLGSTFI